MLERNLLIIGSSRVVQAGAAADRQQERGGTMKSRSRSGRGQGFAEAIAAAIVLIPIALCLLDLIVIVIANSMNDTAAKNAARAAANQKDANSATQAANKALTSFKSSAIVNSITIDGAVDYSGKDYVAVTTKMIVNLPVPFPGYSQMTFVAKDVEPIVNFD